MRSVAAEVFKVVGVGREISGPAEGADPSERLLCRHRLQVRALPDIGQHLTRAAHDAEPDAASGQQVAAAGAASDDEKKASVRHVLNFTGDGLSGPGNYLNG